MLQHSFCAKVWRIRDSEALDFGKFDFVTDDITVLMIKYRYQPALVPSQDWI